MQLQLPLKHYPQPQLPPVALRVMPITARPNRYQALTQWGTGCGYGQLQLPLTHYVRSSHQRIKGKISYTGITL